MEYRVTKLFARGSESAVAEFADVQEAIHFIQEKLTEDQRFKVNASYRLYDFIDLMKEYTQADLGEGTVGGDQQGGGTTAAGRGGAPTPFNTAPRPTGMPQGWMKDDDDKQKK